MLKKIRTSASRLKRTSNRPATGRKGAVAIEFALVFPLLMLFLFACYEIALANMMVHATESAAYEAARVGIVPGAQPAAIRDAANVVLRSVGIKDFTVEVTPAVIGPDTEKVKVEVKVPFRTNNLSLPQIFISDPTFRGTCELNREIL